MAVCRERPGVVGLVVWALVLTTRAAVAAPPGDTSSSAQDQDARTAAKARLEQGAALLAGHSYARALEEFEEAYRIFPSPKIFFDIGLANAGLDRNPDALRAFQRFLIEATDAPPDTVTRAKERVESLLPRVAVVDIVSPQAGLEILVDGQSVGRAPLASPLYLDPGTHRLLARENALAPSVTRAFEVKGGTRITVTVPAVPPPTAAAPPPAAPIVSSPPLVRTAPPTEGPAEERPIFARTWFWVAAGGVVAVAAATLLLTVGRSQTDPTASLGRQTLPVSP